MWMSLYRRHTAGWESEVCVENHRGRPGSVCDRGDLCRLQRWQRLHGAAPSLLRSPETVTGRRRRHIEKIRLKWLNQGKIGDLRENMTDLCTVGQSKSGQIPCWSYCDGYQIWEMIIIYLSPFFFPLSGGIQMAKTRLKLCISELSLHSQKWRDSFRTP